MPTRGLVVSAVFAVDVFWVRCEVVASLPARLLADSVVEDLTLCVLSAVLWLLGLLAATERWP